MQQSLTRSRADGRAGVVVGGLANAVLLWLIHAWPGWEVVPFLTADLTRVLGWVDATLVAGIAVSVVHLVRDPAWLTPAGALVTTAFGVAATVRMLRVFPFDVSPVWATVFRVVLVLGVIGSVVALVVALVSLLRMRP